MDQPRNRHVPNTMAERTHESVGCGGTAPFPITLLAYCVLFTANGAAQTAGALPRVLELPASTRAMALGNAYMMNARHADAVFYHPALLTGASGFGLDLQRWGANSSSTTVSAARQWLGGGIGVGLQTLQYGAAAEGSDTAPGGQDHLFTLGPSPVSERVATVGYSRELFGIDFGVATKLVEQRVGTTRDAGVLFDFGVATDLGPLKAGLTYRNVGSDLSLDGRDMARPDGVTFGVGAYGEPVGILDVGVTGALTYVGDQAIPSGGVEIGYWPIRGRTFVARIGARRVPEGDASRLSFGFAFWGDNITLEWAFQPVDVDGASGTHRFGVRWR